VVVQIFKLFDVYIHQMMPTAFVRLNLYMWLMKTCKLKPTATGFTRLFRCHFQPKMVFVKLSEETTASEAEPQFGVYTFAFHTNLLSPVVAHGNRWGEWTSMWFYHKVPLNEAMQSHPLVVKEFGPLPWRSTKGRRKRKPMLQCCARCRRSFQPEIVTPQKNTE
jgi:hypothetical protein